MKKLFPWIVFLAGLAFVASGLFQRHEKSEFDLDGFAHIPILVNGRIKPLDTVARVTLLGSQDRQTVYLADKTQIHPVEWLLDVAFRPEKADTYPTFKIDNPELLTLIGKTEDQLKIKYDNPVLQTLAVFDFVPTRYRRFSYNEISGALPELERQSQLAQSVDSKLRTPFQRAVLALESNLIAYQQLKYSFVSPDTNDFMGELRELQANLPKGIEAVRLKQAGQPHDEAAAQVMIDTVRRFDAMTRFASLFVVPPANGGTIADWRKVGQVLLDTFKNGEINPSANAFATMAFAWRTQQPELFNQAMQRYHDFLMGAVNKQLDKTNGEVRFNQAEPFYKGMLLYAVVFALGIASWLRWPDFFGRAAYALMIAAFVAATAGIVTRMWLEGRPPVTNLYSSALFVGWGAVGLCILLEAIYRNSIGVVAGGSIGFCTLLIAHHLSFGGDTMEMMRAVLDSNFWLATHVVVVTIGYASTFLAGFLGIIYILLGIGTKWLNQSFDRRLAAKQELAIREGRSGLRAKLETNGEALTRMTYGIICFATLFSLVGTILGGIWADQSWGRFWGWDPKENGALIIVIWNALILHARWGGLVKSRGLMCLAVFGNVVTSWSWFGTNMLGIGLHSYGFMDAAFKWLVGFMIVQAAIILIGALTPLERWRSFGGRAPATRATKPRQPAPTRV
ncbi:MAG TPA: cytochrome c biogenesis protein CcsA [Opitutaceae bacterium]|nr:cytochrome c biogenesis protein CcsA [Opitutaceae bacterium]